MDKLRAFENNSSQNLFYREMYKNQTLEFFNKKDCNTIN